MGCALYWAYGNGESIDRQKVILAQRSHELFGLKLDIVNNTVYYVADMGRSLFSVSLEDDLMFHVVRNPCVMMAALLDSFWCRRMPILMPRTVELYCPTRTWGTRPLENIKPAYFNITIQFPVLS